MRPLSFYSGPLFRRGLVCWKANKKTQILSLLYKRTENLPSISSLLQSFIFKLLTLVLLNNDAMAISNFQPVRLLDTDC